MTPTKLVILSTIACTVLLAAEPRYSRNRELPPLKMNFNDLEAVLTKAFNLLSTANGQSDKKEYLGEKLTVEAGSDELEVAGHAFPMSARVPKVFYKLSYSYSWSSWSDAPVSNLRLDSGDRTRRLAVSGSAADQVEAISTSLERDLSEHASMGGSDFRFFWGSLLAISLVFSLLLTGAYCIVERRWRMLGMPIFSLLGLLLLFLLPLGEWFSGFAVYRGESSFLVRYGPQISFLSLIISVAGIPLGYLIPLWRDTARTKRT